MLIYNKIVIFIFQNSLYYMTLILIKLTFKTRNEAQNGINKQIYKKLILMKNEIMF